ncbi:MAG: 16S rRNA (uracil(1498)-N(3))-methyltransferase [Caulobacteraceae bacterium]|nr:16S rRNA (uracil(1498)-N(3))-methyltransferase [Caulobacteraceae bacterium]
MIRLFVPGDLKAGGEVVPSADQAHYLTTVMRLGLDDELRVFNGRDGEWRARLAEVGKRGRRLRIEARTRAQSAGPDLDLIVALVKRPRLETIIEKAAELGARRVRPVVTERSNVPRANPARLTAIAVEAAEQTGRLDVPCIHDPERLDRLVGAWTGERRLMFCDEAGGAAPVLTALGEASGQSWSILIGPEGGFSPRERALVRGLPGALPVSLGPRILRADTAAICALGLWQAMLGDWRGA